MTTSPAETCIGTSPATCAVMESSGSAASTRCTAIRGGTAAGALTVGRPSASRRRARARVRRHQVGEVLRGRHLVTRSGRARPRDVVLAALRAAAGGVDAVGAGLRAALRGQVLEQRVVGDRVVLLLGEAVDGEGAAGWRVVVHGDPQGGHRDRRRRSTPPTRRGSAGARCGPPSRGPCRSSSSGSRRRAAAPSPAGRPGTGRSSGSRTRSRCTWRWRPCRPRSPAFAEPVTIVMFSGIGSMARVPCPWKV